MEWIVLLYLHPVDVAPFGILVPHEPPSIVTPILSHGYDQISKHNGVHVLFILYKFEFQV